MKTLFFLILAGFGAGALYHFHPEYFESLFAPSATSAPAKPFIPPDPLPQKENWTWTTSTGKTYANVKIVKVDADCVTVLDSDGGARIDISTLPADIQALLNYDPAMAQQAAGNRQKEMGDSQRQEQLLEAAHQAAIIAQASSTTNASNPAPAVASGARQPLTATARQFMVDRLTYLTEDIQQKQTEIAKNLPEERGGLISSQNGLRDVIDQEQTEADSLKKQLAAP